MTKIMYDARGITPKPCGVRNVAENYLREFATCFELIVLANKETAHLVPDGVQLEVAPRYCSRFGPLSDFWVSAMALKHRPEVFFSAHSFLPPFAILPRRKVFICHDLFAALDPSFFAKRGRLRGVASLAFRLLSERSFMRATLVIAPSATVAETFKQLWLKPKSVLVAHNGVRLPDIAKDRIREPVVFYVGNFRGYKGFDLLFDAWRRLVDQGATEGWRLEVATNEPQGAVDRFVAQHGALPGLTFHSRLDDASLLELRQRSRISVVPSRQEGFGIPLLEALGGAGHVVFSDIDVFRELTEKQSFVNWTAFQSGDSEDLSAKLRAAMEDQFSTSGSDETNRRLIEQRYSWSASAQVVAERLS